MSTASRSAALVGVAVAAVVAGALVTTAVAQSGGTIQRSLSSAGRATTFETQHPYANGIPLTTWEVTAALGLVIELEFTSFNVETCCDPVAVYDSLDGSTWEQVGVYYGTGPARALGTRDRYLRVTFSSDGSVTGDGWVAEATARDPVQCGAFYLRELLAPPGIKAARLVDSGSNAASGAVEMYVATENDYEWQSVCADGWGTNDMQVVCRSLGCAGASATSLSRTNGVPTQPQYGVTSVSCSGSESSLAECSMSLGSYSSCSAQASGRCEDCAKCVSVSAISSDLTEFDPNNPNNLSPVVGSNTAIDVDCDGTIRLASDTLETQPNANSVSGRLEMYSSLNNAYGAVCDDHWGDVETQVACAQLGCDAFGGTWYNAIGDNPPATINADDVDCVGTEMYLYQCSYLRADSHNCGLGESVFLICQGCVAESPGLGDSHGQCDDDGSGGQAVDTSTAECTGAIRLAESTLELGLDGTSVTGRLEMFTDDGEWGTVCDDFFSNVAADIACSQLGCPGSGNSFYSSEIHPYPERIAADDVACLGGEVTLYECPHETSNNCGHHEARVLFACLRVHQ